jgi:hypothetical protein
MLSRYTAIAVTVLVDCAVADTLKGELTVEPDPGAVTETPVVGADTLTVSPCFCTFPYLSHDCTTREWLPFEAVMFVLTLAPLTLYAKLLSKYTAIAVIGFDEVAVAAT